MAENLKLSFVVKRPFLILGFLLVPFSLSAQKISEKGDFEAAVAGGGGLYEGSATVKTSDTSMENKEGAISLVFPIKIGYSFVDRLNAELTLQPIVYLTDRGSSGSSYPKGTTYGLGLSYHFLNRKHFASYVAASGGLSRFKNTERIEDGSSGTATYQGSYFDLALGLKTYFSEHFGLFLDANYNIYDHRLREFVVDGEEKDLGDAEYTLGFKGVELSLGVSFSF